MSLYPGGIPWHSCQCFSWRLFRTWKFRPSSEKTLWMSNSENNVRKRLAKYGEWLDCQCSVGRQTAAARHKTRILGISRAVNQSLDANDFTSPRCARATTRSRGKTVVMNMTGRMPVRKPARLTHTIAAAEMRTANSNPMWVSTNHQVI